VIILSERVKVVVIAIVYEKSKEDEEFKDFIKRVREKYANKLGTDNITLKVV
jgi:hypothetical protein